MPTRDQQILRRLPLPVEQRRARRRRERVLLQLLSLAIAMLVSVVPSVLVLPGFSATELLGVALTIAGPVIAVLVLAALGAIALPRVAGLIARVVPQVAALRPREDARTADRIAAAYVNALDAVTVASRTPARE